MSSSPPLSPRSAPITLFTAGTPNGWKASVVLEELGIQYQARHVEIDKGHQKQCWYLQINPNGKIPAIVDHEAGGLAVWESGALMLYLAEKDPHRRLLPTDPSKRAEVLSWLFWQVGGLGPMQGQADWFVLYAPHKDEYAIERYLSEVQRLFEVMNKQLEGKEWLAAGQYTIADIACFCWVLIHDFIGVPLNLSYPHLRSWLDRIKAREAVKRGLNVPSANPVLNKTEAWDEYMKKKAQSLEGLRPVCDAEE